MTIPLPPWGRAAALALLLPVAAAGCGGLHPVRGKVAFEDGAPVTGGMVVFESKDRRPAVTARGEIQPDGTYQLSMRGHGDGAPPGVYRVLIAPPPPDDPRQRFVKPPFDERYTNFATSGLEFEVKAGVNEFPIQVTQNRVRGHKK
jgi:hypothetical protein